MKFKNKYTGTLETYWETGFESRAIIVHDDRGLTKSPEFNNKTQKWDGPLREFKNLEWALFLSEEPSYLKVFEEDKVIWEGVLTLSMERMIEFDFKYSFLPNEVEVKTWLSWCAKEVHVELLTNKKVLAKKKSIKENL